jgi:hypothetical protein
MPAEWTRIEPEQGRIDEKAVARYHAILDCLLRCLFWLAAPPAVLAGRASHVPLAPMWIRMWASTSTPEGGLQELGMLDATEALLHRVESK